MNRAEVFLAVGEIEDRFIAESIRYEPENATGASERIVQMKTKRIVSVALAAALILALGLTALAAWSIHTAKQQELREDMKIEENRAESYMEYSTDGAEDGLVLLSTVNDGQEQRVYVNICPVSEEEAAAFPENTRFTWGIEGTDIGGSAAPQLPVGLSVSGGEEIRAAVLRHAYDRETQTMTIQCFLDVDMVKEAMAELGTDALPLTVQMIAGENTRSFGPVSFTLTEEQRRFFDFGHALYHDAELDKDIEIAGLELTPFSAVWKVHYEGDAAFHTPEADQKAYEPWSLLEDKVCMETKLRFSDGSEFSTGVALTCPYENGTVNLFCGWGEAIDIDDVQRITLNGLVLWKAD